MPRLDNTDPEIVEYFVLESDEPLDLCGFCYWMHAVPQFEDKVIEHPPYVEGSDVCFICRLSLEEMDNYTDD